MIKIGFAMGGGGKIKKVLNESPVKLPNDYIEFLRTISGGENVGVTFEVEEEGLDIYIWSAEVALEKRNREFNYPFNQKEGLIPRSLLRNKLFQDMEEVIY